MRRVYLGAMLGALVSLGLAQPVLAADRVQPLNQYIVKGTGAELDQLGALGYDVTEGADAPGRTGIVATPSQADVLRGQGLRRSAHNTARKNTTSAAPVAAAVPLAQIPTWGYDVYRPWNLEKAGAVPRPSARARSTAGRQAGLRQGSGMRRPEPRPTRTLVKQRRLRHVGQRAGVRRLQGHRRTRPTQADGVAPRQRCSTVAQRAREWISVRGPRGACSSTSSTIRDGGRHLGAAGRERALVHPVFNPDGYDYTFQSLARRACGARTCATTNNDGAIEERRRHRPQPQLLREVALRQRGRVETRPGTERHLPRPDAEIPSPRSKELPRH